MTEEYKNIVELLVSESIPFVEENQIFKVRIRGQIYLIYFRGEYHIELPEMRVRSFNDFQDFRGELLQMTISGYEV